MLPNTSNTVDELPLDAAQPAAAPMSGAVHGVESTAVIIPKIKVPINESCFGSMAYTQAGNPTLKNPAMPMAMKAMKIPSPIVNAGY